MDRQIINLLCAGRKDVDRFTLCLEAQGDRSHTEHHLRPHSTAAGEDNQRYADSHVPEAQVVKGSETCGLGGRHTELTYHHEVQPEWRKTCRDPPTTMP